MKVKAIISAIAMLALQQAVAAPENADKPEGMTPAVKEIFAVQQSVNKDLPCPLGWNVTPNPSMDNSLSYLDDEGVLGVSVTSIKHSRGSVVEPEAYARVAATQMGCQIPVKSDLVADGWSFKCEAEQIEAIVYGSDLELVLLAISGRNAETENRLEDFVRFLSYHAQ